MNRLSDNAIDIIDELMTERLHYFSEYIPLIDAANCLAEYEDLEEQGRLVILPCKIDDEIYYINKYDNMVESDIVKFFTITKDGIKPILKYHNKKFWNFYEWGKNVFLTREEAEAALRGKGNGN